MVGESILQVTYNHTKSSGLYRKIHAKMAQIRGLEVLACKQLRQLIFSFFFKHLGYSKVIEDLEVEERRRRRALKNHKTVREPMMGCPREELPFYRLGIRVLPKNGCQESMPKPLLASHKIPKKLL